ncbi:DUF1893 domain-containing protein [Chloroflexota bacterium]
MYTFLFNEFLTSGDTCQVYKDNKLLFSSNKDRLLPLLEYIDRFALYHQQVVIFDKIMGNAAALLSVKASCEEVYSPLGSQLAVKTLDKYSIKYHLTEIVPYIQKPNGEDMCPMEKLSINIEPEEFYEIIKKHYQIEAGETWRR